MAVTGEDIEKNRVNGTHQQKTMDRVNRKSFGYADRSATDKYWSLLFLIVFIIWASSLYYASHYHESDKIAECNDTKSEGLTPFWLWGHSWLFDTLTFNLAFLGTHYANSGSIVVWFSVIFYVLLIIVSILSMPTNNMFHGQLTTACIIFIILRIYLCFSIVPAYWLLPEAIFIIIWYTKKTYTDDRLKYYHDDMCYFGEYYWLLFMFIAVPLLFASYVLSQISGIMLELDRHSVLFYVIFGATMYLGLALLYFWLLVISCTVDGEMDYESKDHRSRIFSMQFFHALAIVSRYHFGTACYHATLFFPRTERCCIISYREFMKQEKFSTITRRLFVAEYTVNYLTLTSTAVGGTSHGESSKEILRYLVSDSKPRLGHFHGFFLISASVAELLHACNGLTLIFLWANGLDDPYLSFVTWIFYVRLIFIFYIMMKICDAVMNPILLHLKHAPFTCFDLAEYFLNGGKERGPIL